MSKAVRALAAWLALGAIVVASSGHRRRSIEARPQRNIFGHLVGVLGVLTMVVAGAVAHYDAERMLSQATPATTAPIREGWSSMYWDGAAYWVPSSVLHVGVIRWDSSSPVHDGAGGWAYEHGRA